MNIIAQKQSGTIRIMPENYLLAHKQHNEIICNPDLAVTLKEDYKNLAIKCFTLLLEHSSKYGTLENLKNLLEEA